MLKNKLVALFAFQSEYSGQIRTLMGYIDPKTDIVVAAGGDGTLFEVHHR